MGVKKCFVLTAVLGSSLIYCTAASAAYTADPNHTNRAVRNVTASSIDIRTQPSTTAPLITTQKAGSNEVETVPNESTIVTSAYSYQQFDYVSNSVGKYSDSYSGYGTTENNVTLTNLVESCNLLYNYTATPDNFWYYSNLSTALGTLGVGATYRGGWVYAADDNPNAWLVSYSSSYGSYAYINGWYVNAYQ